MEDLHMYCEACGVLSQGPLYRVARVAEMRCHACGFVALRLMTPFEAAEERAFQESLERGHTPPDTPLAEWIAGVDQFLDNMRP